MVNTGRPSTGCRTCKTRRVKCDDQHPTCARCDRGGFICRGYDDPVLFIDESARLHRAARVYNGESAEGTSFDSHEEASNYMTAVEQPSLSKHTDTLDTVHEHTDTLPCYVSPDISSLEEEIQLSFLCSKLFVGAPARGQRTLVEKPWIYQFALQFNLSAQHDSEQIPMSFTCALATQALAKAFFGQMHGQPSVTDKGAYLYGNALHSLRDDFQNFNAYASFPLLASLMTVYLYELVVCTEGGNRTSHLWAIAHLMEWHGPSSFKPVVKRSMFESMRRSIIGEAMANRKRTFLEQKNWRTVPWEDEPDSKSHLDYVTDIMADIPGLYEDLDAINASPNTHLSSYSTIANDIHCKCLENLSKLESWAEVWKAQNPDSFSEVAPGSMSSLTINEDMDLFPTVRRYTSLGVANESVLYCSTRIQLLTLWREVDQHRTTSTSMATSTAFETNISRPSHETSDRDYTAASIKILAINICRSAEYHFLHAHMQAGALLFLIPAQVAAKSLGLVSREGRWIIKLLVRASGLSGLRFSRRHLSEGGSLAMYKMHEVEIHV